MNPSIIGVVAAAVMAGSASTGPKMTTTRVSDRVVVVNCASNNVTAVAASDGIIVVDSHRSPGLMRDIAGVFAEELGRDDFGWLINTHAHWDHCSGNQVLEGATRIGHELCAEAIASYPERAEHVMRRRKQEMSRLAAGLEDLDPDSPRATRARERLAAQRAIVDDLENVYVPTPPTNTFRDRIRIDAGDVNAEGIFCGAAHTDHDVFVFVPEESILLTGDVFCSPNSFCFSVNALVDVPRLLAVMDEVLERASDDLTVIPGHGDLMTRDDLVNLRSRLESSYRGVQVEASAARRAANGAGIDDVEGELYFDEVEFHMLARRCLGRSKVREAIGALEIAVERLPDSALVHSTLAEAYLMQGDGNLAIEHYQRSLELDPHNRTASELLEILRSK